MASFCGFSEDSPATTSFSIVSPLFDSTPKYAKSAMPKLHLSQRVLLFFFALSDSFPLGPLTRVLALQSALMWPMRPQRKHLCMFCPSVHLQCCLPKPRIGDETFCRFNLNFRTVHFIFTFHEHVTICIVIMRLFGQIANHHWSGTTDAAVNDCHNMRPLLHNVWKHMLLCCQLFFKMYRTQERKMASACLWVMRFQCVPNVFSSWFLQCVPVF